MAGTVLITGAGGGFGYEFACQLERQGYHLLLHGRDEVRLQMTLDALREPEHHRIILGELSARKDLERLIADVEGEEALTGLVNNAGFGTWGGFRLCESVAQLDVLRVDLVAPVALTHALLPILSRNNGFVINVSSLAGETPLPYMSTYAAAKAGLTYWSEALRAEERGRLRVVTLAPGPSPTNFRRVSGAPAGKGSLFRIPAEAVVAASLRTLAKGGGYCVPGFRHRALWLLQKLMPRRIAVAIMARYLEE